MIEEYAIYLRKSRADAEAESRGEGETLARHQNTLFELAKKQNLNIVKIYKEIVSGDSISARPQMQNLLSDISENKYQGVLVMEVERLARGDTIDQGIVAQAFKQSNTLIITPVKTYDPNNEFDEEYFEFSLFMSRREYKTIKRRMQAGRLSAVKEGNYISSRNPYGYRKVSPEPKIHTLEIIPHEAEIIRMMFDMYINQNKGAKAIAEYLNKSGIKPQKSDYWESPSIKKILANPLYCGKIQWDSKIYEGLHKGIVSEDTFNKAQYKRKNNPAAQLHPNDVLHNYYNGILYCSNCGHQLKRRSINGTEHMLCIYRQCRGIIVSASMRSVDEAVLSSFRYRIEKLEKLQSENTDNTPLPDSEKSDSALKETLLNELEKINKQKDKLCDLLEQEIYSTEKFLERTKILNDRQNEIENNIRQIDEKKSEKKLPPNEAITAIKNVIKHFPDSDAYERNRLLKTVAKKIYYTKTQRMCRNLNKSDLTIKVDFL